MYWRVWLYAIIMQVCGVKSFYSLTWITVEVGTLDSHGEWRVFSCFSFLSSRVSWAVSVWTELLKQFSRQNVLKDQNQVEMFLTNVWWSSVKSVVLCAVGRTYMLKIIKYPQSMYVCPTEHNSTDLNDWHTLQ